MDINLWWIKRLLPMRHDGYIFDAWEGGYPSFRSSRQEMLKIHIRLYRSKTK